MVSKELNFKTFGSLFLFSDGLRRNILVIGVSSFIHGAISGIFFSGIGLLVRRW